MTPSFSILRWLFDTLAARDLSVRASSTGSVHPRLSLEALEERSLPSATPFSPQAVALPFASPPLSPDGSTAPYGYTPSQVGSAYGFNQISFLSSPTNPNAYNQNAGKGQTIAIVDSYNDPTITQDANTFSSQYGLPTFNGGGPTLSVVNQLGGSALPATANSGWAMETALDVEWAHAIAPQANIVLVEANSNNDNDLFAAVNYAASVAPVVSMSWGGGEFSGETSASFDGLFSSHPQVTFVAAAGDHGLAPSYPAVSPNVVSVGGTSLHLTSTGQWSSETGWGNGGLSSSQGGSGGGISQYEAEPGYQKLSYASSVAANGSRMGPDVAYDGDPNSGFSVYDSTGSGGWVQVGGTSAGAPQWAALVALADQGRGSAGPLGSAQVLNALYCMAGSTSATGASLYGTYFHDITTGNNGASAGAGYDLVTGLGSPQANNVVSYLVNNVAAPAAATPAPAASPSWMSALLPSRAQAAASALAVTSATPSTAPESPLAPLLYPEQASVVHAEQKAPDLPLLTGLLAHLDEAPNPLLLHWIQDSDAYRQALSALLTHKETPWA